MKVFLDTSILIDFYRKEKKEKTEFYKLVEKNYSFAVSVITEYEIFVGSNGSQDDFWAKFFKEIEILPLTSPVAHEAVLIYKDLKKENNLIDIPDLLIGATAKYHNLSIATLNYRHFNRIKGLELL